MYNKGLTLVEILVAAGFILFVAAGGYFYFSHDGGETVREENKTKSDIIIPDSNKDEEQDEPLSEETQKRTSVQEHSEQGDIADVEEPQPAVFLPEVEDEVVVGTTHTEKEETVATESSENMGIPTNLSLPFNIEDIDGQNGELNPLGVVRFSKDEPRTGHSGIDIPLREGANVYAVADGTVVIIKSAGDPWGGRGIYQLLQKTKTGEGWGFIYEHTLPVSGIEEGSKVTRGQLIATKAAPAGFTAHFQMSYHFNTYQYTSDVQCWPDFLSTTDKNNLDTWWESYNKTSHLLSSWESTTEEGKYPFKGLLNTAVYSNGPQFCYPLGTDVR